MYRHAGIARVLPGLVFRAGFGVRMVLGGRCWEDGVGITITHSGHSLSRSDFEVKHAAIIYTRAIHF